MAEGQDMNGRVMSDEELRELFSAYIDGQVSAEVREQIEHRVADDADLRDELESLRELVADLSSLPAEPAPEGFTARVMQGVEGLEIPAPGSRAAGSESLPEQALESLAVPLWLKGSIAASLAATLALGFVVFRAPLDHRSQEMASMDLGEDAEPSWGAPVGTGVDELPVASEQLSALEDGVVALDLAEDEAQARLGGAAKQSEKQDKSMPGESPATSVGPNKRQSSQGSAPALLAIKRGRGKSGLREVVADRTFPAGVYEAEHEEPKSAAIPAVAAADPVREEAPSQADGVAAVDQENPALDEGENFENIELDMSQTLARRGGHARRSQSVSSRKVPAASSAPMNSLADEAAGDALGFKGQGVGLDASSEVAVVSEEKGGDSGDMPSIAAKVAIGTLRVSSPGVIATMSSEIASRSWSVQNLTPMPEGQNQLPAVGSQLLQITVPEGDEEAVSGLLSSYGALNLDRVLAAAHDGNARLRLTVRWGN